MIPIKSKDILDEPQIVEYINMNRAVYGLDKSSLLYQGLLLWCRLYNQRPTKLISITRETDNYVYFTGHVPLTKKNFSRVFLSDIKGNNKYGYATSKFVKYLNKRYKALYTRDLFNVVSNVTPDMTCPYAHNNKYYANIRTQAMMQNIDRGILKLDYSKDPYYSPDIPDSKPMTKHEVIYHNLLYNASELPFEQVSKTSILYRLVKLWTSLHQQTLDQTVIGFKQDKHYIYFGMSTIPHNPSWTHTHPNHYSDVDYFLLGGTGDCYTMNHFIDWARNSTLAKTKANIKKHNVLHISKH